MIGGIHPMMMTPVGGGVLKPQDVFAATTIPNTFVSGGKTITTGIDIPTYGGLVWLKVRNDSASHQLFDTNRSAKVIYSNSSNAQEDNAYDLESFLSSGYKIGNGSIYNSTAYTSVGWSFRRAAKFFDVVTYTGNGVAGRQIAHALGVAPGMVIIKQMDASNPWNVYHRALGFSGGGLNGLRLNETTGTGGLAVPLSATDATTITLQSGGSFWNAAGNTYVAYLFAHDTDASGIVQCGSYVGNASVPGPTITLGWRPQFVLTKKTSASGDWHIIDSARSVSDPRNLALFPNAANAETSAGIGGLNFLSSGFQIAGGGTLNGNGDTYIYVAIREPI